MSQSRLDLSTGWFVAQHTTTELRHSSYISERRIFVFKTVQNIFKQREIFVRKFILLLERRKGEMSESSQAVLCTCIGM